jgi:hypothetical protein
MSITFKEWWAVSPTWKRIGMMTCISGAIGCLSIGLVGIVAIGLDYHAHHDWLSDGVCRWMEIGLPCTVATFFFTRAMEVFK